MDFRVEVKGTAIADLAEIVSYVAQDNPEAATKLFGSCNRPNGFKPQCRRVAIPRNPSNDRPFHRGIFNHGLRGEHGWGAVPAATRCFGGIGGHRSEDRGQKAGALKRVDGRKHK